MSYMTATALQRAVYGCLQADPVLTGFVGSAVFDTPPIGTPPSEYVVLGPEEARDWSDKTGRATLYRLTISVRGEAGGFHRVKEIAAAVDEALTTASFNLGVGRLVNLNFERARARRLRAGNMRGIDLRFRALVDETA